MTVIRNAESRDLWDLAAEITRLAEAARAGKASREELSGSTITISSLGPMGGIASTPVINRPEVAIIAVNKVKETPVVVDGELEMRKMMNLSLTCDHRVVDGWDAANFMQALKAPDREPAEIALDALRRCASDNREILRRQGRHPERIEEKHRLTRAAAVGVVIIETEAAVVDSGVGGHLAEAFRKGIRGKRADAECGENVAIQHDPVALAAPELDRVHVARTERAVEQIGVGAETAKQRVIAEAAAQGRSRRHCRG